ncbi:MAG: spermidine/putrescine ABC transporter substrate-binding protein [Anaerolineae bacterium]|nr:spermidine/putrescine ABC transporter substrate-binding protein [Anaerolineae bacterium]
MKPQQILCFTVILALIALSACSSAPAIPPTPTSQPLAQQLTIYNWEGGLPQEILDAFTAEYGVTIDYQTFTSYAEAVSNLEAGKGYDVVFMGNDFIGQILGTELLAELDLSNIPNMRNISVNFRDLSYDPGNLHSIPFGWGTTGLVVRSDLFDKPVTSWNALWEAEVGKSGIWDDRRALIGLTLRSLGFSANSDKPEELEAALNRLLELKGRVISLESIDPWTSAPALDSGQITIALGWAYDGIAGRDLNPAIEYVIPQEGTLLWLENMVIPANSPNKYTAEMFINFMLRPEIAGQYVNATFFAVANEPAKAFIDPTILNDPIVYPTQELLTNAELLLPLSAETKAIYDAIWDRFMQAPGGITSTSSLRSRYRVQP